MGLFEICILYTGLFFVKFDITVELVSKELNHFGVIAGIFRQIGAS